MYEHIKKRIVKNLVDEVLSLDPTDLELVGHNVISVLESKKLIHKGINKEYKPVKSTVDSFSHDSMTVGEYSTEQNYFENRDNSIEKDSPSYLKIKKDIEHAISHRAPNGPDRIYLVTSQEEPPSFRAKFNRTKLGVDHGVKIVFLDAVELARTIYGQSITNPEHADFYKQFFPRFSADLDNYEYYGKLPPQCGGHIHANLTIKALNEHFQSQSVCVLFGISGAGKTEAAIDFVRSDSEDFENYIWISGDDWKKDTPLSSVQRTRGGTPINVTGLFNRGKCLLVIDNLERTVDRAHFSELERGFESGGIILITSQLSAPGDPIYLSIPEMSSDVAAQVLGEDLDTASVITLDFITKCRFSPLILSIAKATIAQSKVSPEELYLEVLDSPGAIASNGESILRRILDRLDHEARKALESVANTEIGSHDAGFLRHFIGISNCRKLQQLSILMPTRIPNILRIHDLVRRAALSEVDTTHLVTKIESYIDNHRGEMPPSVLREIFLARRPISEEHQRRGRQSLDWLAYAMLQIDSSERAIICEELNGFEIVPVSSLQEVMCVIDAREAYGYTLSDVKVRQAYFSESAELYEKAFNASSSEEIKAELLHHRGKALRRTGRYKDALRCFTDLLELKANWHATHLQIATLGTQTTAEYEIKSAGESSMRVLLDAISDDSSSVPLRVSLAALARLRSYRAVANEVSDNPARVSALADVIGMAALEGLHQLFEAFVSFTSVFSYKHSTCCIDLAEKLSDMLALPPDTVDRDQWVSACEALINTAIAAGRENREILARQLVLAGLRFAEAINQRESLKAYDARAIAKAYIQASLPENAIAAIAKVPNEYVDHWVLYRKAEAEGMLDKSVKALRTAKDALRLAKDDPKAKNNVASYHDLLSKCYESIGQLDEALMEAKNALGTCKDDRYSTELSARIGRLELGQR